MIEIADREIYVQRMAATLADKCWWVDHLPPEIDTVVDYGCAEGDLGLYLDRIHPGRFRYIGIDNSPEMLVEARKHVDGMFYSCLEDAARAFDPERSVLILSSVIHEIMTYLGEDARETLFYHLADLECRYIAIRDMYLFNADFSQLYHFDDITVPCPWYYVRAIERSAYRDAWCDYCREASRIMSPTNAVVEFLLKYRYTENWEREKRERYLWDWLDIITRCIQNHKGYWISHDEKFHIPYLRQQVKKDFGVDLPICTHRKLLLERYKNESRGEIYRG